MSPELQEIVSRIDTGTADPETSRALVVFNLTAQPQSGIAVFHASMSWPSAQPLPPISVTTMGGEAVPAGIHYMTVSPDLKGRPDREQLSFEIRFAVTDVPANGWRTYIAAYADASSPDLRNDTELADLIVVETTRHGGDLPPTGNF